MTLSLHPLSSIAVPLPGALYCAIPARRAQNPPSLGEAGVPQRTVEWASASANVTELAGQQSRGVERRVIEEAVAASTSQYEKRSLFNWSVPMENSSYQREPPLPAESNK